MWHEARKQEKLIRGMIVDYRRRAERRKDFYEKIKAEPTQFLQLHGRPCKIHLDPAVAMAGEGPAIMMQWQGDSDDMIDRFDVRAHLDLIPEVKVPDVSVEELSQEERHCNYERYRILAQNAFLGINEDKFLQQLLIEEQFGVTLEEKEMQKEKLHERKGTGAAIGYNYNDPGAQPSSFNGMEAKKVEKVEKIDKDSDDDSDLDILDVDLSIDVNKMEPAQAHDLNSVGPQFGMAGCDLFSFLTGDADDAEHQKQLLIEEKEKAMYSGRKSRRERRAHRDKKLASRVMSPPSYAAPTCLPATERETSRSPSPSRSLSPDANDHIQFITSFGDDEEEAKPPLPKKPTYSEKVKQNLKKLYSEVAQMKTVRADKSEEYYRRPIGPRGPNSRSVSPTTISSESPKSKSRSRSRSRFISRSSSSSRSRSRSPNRGRSSRSPANNSAKRNRSRSNSYESKDRSGGVKPPQAVPRYYGRRKEDKSSSELSFESGSSESEPTQDSSVGNKSNTNQNQLRSSGSGSKGPSRDAMSLKEKLKKKMQAQLARQLRADKRAEAERLERESRRQARRDEEMRELAIKLRRKQREIRHKHQPSSEESDKSRSRSSSRDSGPPGTSVKLSRSRSNSPEKSTRPPVWEHETEPPVNSEPIPKPEDHPPYDRRRYQNPDYEKSYYPENNLRSRSPSPHKIPVWEVDTRSVRPAPSYTDLSRNRFDDEQTEHRQDRSDHRHEYKPEYRPERPEHRQEYKPDHRQEYKPDHRQEYKQDHRQESRYENPRSYQRYDNRHEPQSEDRWDTRRRPYSQRGGYREYNRPGPSGDNPNTWARESRDYKNDKNKVKLVDY